MTDRIEYLMRLTHDHCDDGDEISRRQLAERVRHITRTQELLALARGCVELLEDDLRRYGPSVEQIAQQRPPQQATPQRIAPIRKEASNA